VLAGANYLVVWQDGWIGEGATADIFAARLKANGLTVLDKSPIAVCKEAEAQFAPSVAAAGDVCLVVWQDFRNGKDQDVRGILVDAKSGKAVGTEIEIAVRPRNQVKPAVSAQGDTFLVVWQEAIGTRNYGIRGVRVSKDGKVLDGEPHAYADNASNPAVSASEGKFLVAWAGQARRVCTMAALVDEKTGKAEKTLGGKNGILAPCSNAIAIAHDGGGSFMTVAAREGYPNPWGWPGPGAVLCSRVNNDGSTPESELDYAYRLNNVCGRKVPNVVDTATWGKADKWHAGAPGGFKGTRDGLWPNGWPGVVYDGKGTYLFVWVKGKIAPDRLNLLNFDIWLRGMDAKTLAVTVPDRKIAADPDAGETRPSLVQGKAGQALLIYERLKAGEKRRIAARDVSW
jgi:hypothetical protein